MCTKFFKWKTAVNYAINNWNSACDFEGDDCTSFVSRCWWDAGVPQEKIEGNKTDGWYFDNSSNYHHSYAWMNVKGFYDWMVTIRGLCDDLSADDYSANFEKAKLGDIIQLRIPYGNWFHSAIITKIDKYGTNTAGISLYYACHTDPHRCKLLLPIYLIRLLHIKDKYRSAEGNLEHHKPPSDPLFWGDIGPIGPIDTTVEKVQKKLNSLDSRYYCGPPDNMQGANTTDAIKRFQRDKGLEVDGIIGPDTLAALGITED